MVPHYAQRLLSCGLYIMAIVRTVTEARRQRQGISTWNDFRSSDLSLGLSPARWPRGSCGAWDPRLALPLRYDYPFSLRSLNYSSGYGELVPVSDARLRVSMKRCRSTATSNVGTRLLPVRIASANSAYIWPTLNGSSSGKSDGT